MSKNLIVEFAIITVKWIGKLVRVVLVWHSEGVYGSQTPLVAIINSF